MENESCEFFARNDVQISLDGHLFGAKFELMQQFEQRHPFADFARLAIDGDDQRTTSDKKPWYLPIQ